MGQRGGGSPALDAQRALVDGECHITGDADLLARPEYFHSTLQRAIGAVSGRSGLGLYVLLLFQ